MKTGIALATYKPDPLFFRLQVESLQRQTVDDWICVVSDDGSGVEVRNLIREICGGDPRFELQFHADNVGVVQNFSRALGRLKGRVQFIAFCDQDDVWDSEKLKVLRDQLNENPKIQMIHHDLRVIDQNGIEMAESCWKIEQRTVQAPTLDDLIFRNPVTGCAAMFREELLEKALPIPVRSGLGQVLRIRNKPHRAPYYHDVWFALKAQGKLVSLPRVLMSYRQHPRNVVGAGGSLKRFNFFESADCVFGSRRILAVDAGLRFSIGFVVWRFARACWNGNLEDMKTAILIFAGWTRSRFSNQ